MASTERCGSFSIWPNVGGCPAVARPRTGCHDMKAVAPKFSNPTSHPWRESRGPPPGVRGGRPPSKMRFRIADARSKFTRVDCSADASPFACAWLLARPDGSAQWELRAGSPLRPSQQAHDVTCRQDKVPHECPNFGPRAGSLGGEALVPDLWGRSGGRTRTRTLDPLIKSKHSRPATRRQDWQRTAKSLALLKAH